jgi:hypothetical protein
MSWRELERLVCDAERQPPLRQALSSCRDEVELLLTARRCGYRITRMDLLQAWQQHEEERLHHQRQGRGKGGEATC